MLDFLNLYRYALDDMILFIEDEQPTEEEIIEKTAELLQK